jgi:NADPH-dependent curcumin reductase CurA
MSYVNRQLRLKTRPEGLVKRENFDLVEQAVPELKDGEVLLRVLYLSMDPTNRVWMRDIPQYMPPVAIGEVMRALGIGRVVQSRSAQYRRRSGARHHRLAGLRWSARQRQGLRAPACRPRHSATDPARRLRHERRHRLLRPHRHRPGAARRNPGGLRRRGLGRLHRRPDRQDHGARVVGIAGGADKCRYLVDELGFDAAVDYKAEDWKQQLKDATPDGVHVNFENVGGEVMRAVLSRMVIGGRVALCGLISGYNSGERPSDDYGVFVMKRLSMRGFLILDYTKTREAVQVLGGWIRDGRLKAEEAVADGLENAPEVLNRLFDGSHRGKLVLRVDMQA